MKISFLMAAHNEEKIIAKALENLFKLDYNDFEVIIGLDGCTDKTEQIVQQFVKKSKVFKYYSLNLRAGKTSVINEIVKHSSGEILIIHDADWIFRVGSRKDIDYVISLFNDKKIGGIAESFPLHYMPKRMNKKPLLELGVIWSTYAWMDYVKKKFTRKKSGVLILDKKTRFPMLVNIFRRELFKKNHTVGDDFERCIDILNSGYEVVMFDNEKLPRMVSYGEKVNWKQLLKQKERTAIARKQIKEKYNSNYNLGLGFYWHLLKLMSKIGLRGFIGLIVYIIVFFIGSVKSIFVKDKSTKSAWKMRLQR